MTRPFQWWPNVQVPRDSAPHPTVTQQPDGFSGRLQFLSSDASLVISAADPPPFRKLCAREFSKPTPCVLQTGVRSLAGAEPGIGIKTVDLIAGQIGFDLGLGGFFIVEYGTGAAQQVVAFDLRQGSYQLPPCTEVRVFAGCYDSDDGGSFGKNIEVTGALTEGVCAMPKRPTLSVQTFVDIAASAFVRVPDGAVDVDLFCPAVETIGAGQPFVHAYAVNNLPSSSLHRDYSLGIWAPPYPIACQGSNNGSYEITTNVDDTLVVMQFGIEF